MLWFLSAHRPVSKADYFAWRWLQEVTLIWWECDVWACSDVCCKIGVIVANYFHLHNFGMIWKRPEHWKNTQISEPHLGVFVQSILLIQYTFYLQHWIDGLLRILRRRQHGCGRWGSSKGDLVWICGHLVVEDVNCQLSYINTTHVFVATEMIMKAMSRSMRSCLMKVFHIYTCIYIYTQYRDLDPIGCFCTSFQQIQPPILRSLRFLPLGWEATKIVVFISFQQKTCFLVESQARPFHDIP